MLVPRSFKYASSPPASMIDHKSTLRNPSRDDNDINSRSVTSDAKDRSHASVRPHTPTPQTTDTMRPRSQPVDVPSPEKARRSGSQTVGYAKGRSAGAGRRKQVMPDQHRAEALSPSVAALLAMTTIPRRPKQTRRRSSDRRQISIDELVNEWKSDERLAKSYESSPLSILLEDADDSDASRSPSFRSNRHGRPQYERSPSSDSVPSLEGDQNSLFSVGSPATPDSLRSRKSSMNMRKETPKSQPARESCAEDHPLASLPGIDDEDFDYASTPLNSITSKPKSSFKSNLTTSLQALKSAALSSFAPRKTTSAPNLRSKRTTTTPESTKSLSPLPDDVLWSHPFLFPRFSPEVRPAYKGTPTSAERRYLNPIPLSFEEQEAPFQQALHAPYLAEQHVHHGPTIQMQTYSRSGRSGKGKTGSVKGDVDSASANKAAVAAMMRQREPRENSDFLRIVVMEMNMRREGKLEMGRAKIWLPPRQTAESDVVVQGKVPRRWIGESVE